MKVDGACLCGEVSFEAEVDPRLVFVCHCTDCQTHSGSAFRTIAVSERDTFRLLSGEVREYLKRAESGAQRALGFCPSCGTALYGGPGPGERGPLSLRTGVLQQRGSLRPVAQLWCRSAQGWLDELGTLPRVDEQSG